MSQRLAKEELSSSQSQISSLQTQLDDSKTYTTNLKSANKTLRDEMRKVQSSVQLMEKQRNPGVGYWSASSPAASSSNHVGGPGPMRSGITSPGEDSEISTPTKERKSLESCRSESGMEQKGTPARGEGSLNGDGRDKDEEEVNLEVGARRSNVEW